MHERAAESDERRVVLRHHEVLSEARDVSSREVRHVEEVEHFYQQLRVLRTLTVVYSERIRQLCVAFIHLYREPMYTIRAYHSVWICKSLGAERNESSVRLALLAKMLLRTTVIAEREVLERVDNDER